MAKQPDDGSQKLPDHIGQIRDIIFGPQKREYDERLEKLASETQRIQNEARSRTDEVHASLQAHLAKLEKDIHQLEHCLTNNLSTRIQAVNDTTSAMRQELADTRSAMQSELRLTREKLSREMDAQVSGLVNSKVSGDFMAEILQEMALRLKGVDVLEGPSKANRKLGGA
jgi:chromosome segregation ATPase